MAADHGAGEIAAIKGIARGGEAGLPPAPRRRLLVDHVPDGAGEVGLHEAFADDGRLSPGEKDVATRLPATVLAGMGGEVPGHQRVNRKPFVRVAKRGRCDIGERHRAVPPERGDPGIGRGGDDGPQDAIRDPPPEFGDETFERCGPRPPAESADRRDPVLVGKVDHDRRDTGELHQIAVQHAEGDPRRDPGVDGVAARFEHLVARLRRQVMTGGDHVMGGMDRGLHRHW